MAKLTKAEQKQAEAIEKHHNWEKIARNWIYKFTELMFLYPKTGNFYVEAVEGDESKYVFVPDTGNGNYTPKIELPVMVYVTVQDWEAHYRMQDAFQDIEDYENGIKEQIRKQQVIENARIKIKQTLSKEELKLLDLPF